LDPRDRNYGQAAEICIMTGFICSCDQVSEVSGTFSTLVTGEKCIQDFTGKPKEKKSLGNHVVGGRIILKSMLLT
jgi:hypothetical protein